MRDLGSASTKRLHFSFSLAVLIVFLIFGILMYQQATDSAKALRPCFVIAPGATTIRATKFKGEDQLSYRIQAPYPADHVLAAIGGRLEKMGWKPLKEDFLNPGQTSSHVRGFQYFPDPTTQPKSSARRWVGQWENGTHDIVGYMLEYRCPEESCSSTRDLHDLQVMAIYFPAKLAAR
jgi:hypothetical protein